MDTTTHDLKILSICYYIQAGIIACYSLFILGYAAFIGTLIQHATDASGRTVPPWLAPLLVMIFVAAFVFAVSIALCEFLTGRWLVRYKNRMFCQIIAGLSCLTVPYGTALGIFTFLVLSRPEARRLFSSIQPAWAPPAPPAPPVSVV